MRRILIVFIGGGIGATLRAALLAWLDKWNTFFPVPVLLANLLGSFVLGMVFVLADEAGLLRAEMRLFVAVGVLGGFTTFSTFGWGADLLLAHTDHWGAAAIYLAASVTGGVAAVGLGLAAGRALMGPRSHRQAGDRHAEHADMAAIEAENREERT